MHTSSQEAKETLSRWAWEVLCLAPRGAPGLLLVHALLLCCTSPHVRLHLWLHVPAGAVQQLTRGCSGSGGLLELHSATEQQQQQPAAADALGATGSLVCFPGEQTDAPTGPLSMRTLQ
jgi:hypothetical protein